MRPSRYFSSLSGSGLFAIVVIQLLGGFVHVASAAPNYGWKDEAATTTVMAEHAAKKNKGYEAGTTEVIAVVVSTVQQVVPVTLTEQVTRHVTVGYSP
jgi:hypothetical protein